MQRNPVSKYFLCLFFLLSVTTSYGQIIINITNGGDEGPTSGTNWSISGTTLTVTGEANIQASVIENALSSGNLTVVSATGSEYIIEVNDPIDYEEASERTLTFGATHRVLVYENISSTSAALNIILASEFDRASVFTGAGFGVGVFSDITTNGGDVWIGGGQLTGSWNGHTVGVGAAMGGGGGANGNGVGVEISNSSISTDGGDVRILGTSNGSPGINAYQGNSTIDAGAGDIELISDRMGFDSTNSKGDIQIDGTGTLTIAPLESSFVNAVTWDATKSGVYYTSTGGANTIDGLKIKNTLGLTIGKPDNSAPLTIASDIVINGPISFESGSLTIKANLETTSEGADILAKVNDYVDGQNASDGQIYIYSNKDITTNGGNIILWSNASNRTSGQANNEIVLDGSNTLTSNGGKIVLAGGLDGGDNNGTAGDGIPDGYAYRSGYGGSAVDIRSDVSLLSDGGDVIMRGHSGLAGAPGSPRTFGVWASAGFKLDAGTGTINIRGKSESESAIWLGTTEPSGALSPIAITSASTAANAITIHGESTTNSHGFIANWDGTTGSNVLIQSSASIGGGVSITGITNGALDGIILGQTGTSESIQILSQAGDVSLISNEGLYFGNDSFLGNRKDGTAVNGVTPSVQTSSANIIVRANSFNGSSAIDVSAAGELTIEPYGNVFSSAYSTSGLTLGSALTGLTIGKSTNTANVTISNAIDIAGPITVYGGDIAVNENLNTTAGGALGDMLLKASGNITQAASKSITTNGGNIILWSNASNRTSGQANNEIVLYGSNTLTSNGGKIVLAGGLDGGDNNGTAGDGIPDGYAYRSENSGSAVDIRSNVSLLSGGGDVIMRGHSGLTGGTLDAVGVWADTGFKLDAGTGTINIRGNSDSRSGIWLGLLGGGVSQIAITSASTAATAITIHGESTTNEAGFVANWDGTTGSNVLIQSSASIGGGVTITGITNGTNGIVLGQTGTSESFQILSQAGDVSLISNQGLYIGNDTFLGNRKDANAVNGITPSVQTSSADVLARVNSFNVGSATIDVSAAGELTIEPYGNVFSSAYSTSGLTLVSALTGLTIGKSTNTANVTISNAIDIAGPITVYGGDIDVNANLTSTVTNADIVLKASGTVEIQDNTGIETNGGDLILWSNSDNVNGGNALMGQNVTLDSRQGGASTGGGHIHIAGGADTNSDGFPDDATAGIGNFTGGSAYGILFGNAAPSGVQLLSGGGNITLIGGVDGNFNSGANSHGIGFYPGYTVDAGAGSISFTGYGNSGGANTFGIDLMTFGAQNASSISTTGDLTLNGVTTVTTNTNHGIIINTGLTVNAGTVDVTGDSDDAGIILNGSVVSDGTIDLKADKYSFSSGSISGQGTVSIEPLTASSSFSSAFSNSSLTLGSALTGLTIGKSTNTADVTIASEIDIAGPITVYGGDIAVNENLNTTAGGALGDMLLKASGNITQAASKSITTSGGDVTLWADSDGSGAGYIQLTGGSSSGISSGGGNVFLGGGTDLATGYARGAAVIDSDSSGFSFYIAGVHLRNETEINSGGGNITLRGQNVGNSAGHVQPGIMGIGTTLDAGTGKIALYGLAGGSGIANAQAISTSAAGSGWTIRSASTEADAITLIGDATSTNSSATSLGINFAGIIEATGNGGGIALTGTSGTSTSFGDGLGIVGDVLAASGTITITGTDDATNVNNRDVFIVGATLGSKTATNVTSSTANVVVRGNRPAFGSNVAVNTSGTFTLEPAGDDFTNAITYPIADLSLDAAVSGLTIGKASSADGTSDANVTIASAVDVAGPITVYGGDLSINSALTATAADINLHASGTVSQSAALTANGLGLHGGGTFTLQNSSNNVATIAGGTSGIRLGNIVYRDVNTLEIGSVNPDGIFSSGTVLIETENGNLTLSENINTTSTSDEAIILNAGRASSARTSSGGDIIISGSPTLTYGTGGRAKLFSGAEENSNLNTFVGGNENTRRGFDEVSQPNNLEDDTTYAIYRYGNLAPSVTSTSVTSATAESLYLYDIKSSDPENDFISWSVTTIPDWLTFSSDAVQTNFLGTGVRPTNTGDGTNQASDGTTASSAVISTGTAAHGDNKLFFTDKEEYGIRYVDSNGQVQTWYQGDGNWQSLNPVGIVYDVTNDAVYVGDYSRSDILKIDNNGSKTLLSDLPEPFMFRLLLNSSNSKLYVSARGGIYEIDLTNNNPSTNYKRVVGTGRFGYSDTGLASTSQVFFPHGMDFDSSGRLVFTDRYNDIIRRVNLSEDTIETIAGKQGQGVESGDGGLAINATFADPSGLVINENDEIFISERLSKRIRKINVNGTIDTFFRVSSGGFADDLVISATGELYLLTSNLVAQVATVAKLTGTPTNADAGTHDVKLILSDGVNYTPYNFQITVDSKLIGATVVVTDNLTSEDGDTGSFTLVLDSKPTADVTISLSSSDTGEGSIAVSSVTFTPSNWNTPQIITVTGVDDVLSDGPKDYQIVTGNVTSSDINYNALDGTTINDAGFSNEDNDPDADGDGREDNADAFPTDPSEDTDTDGDGTGDNKDIFPNDPDRNGDTDGDGVSDPFDLCPGTVAGESVDANGCAASQRDTDDDGINDNLDNCVTTTNPDQSDVDGDGVGDVCDNAPNTPNEDQRDTDGDGIPDAVDEDDDNDGVPDAQDDFPTDPNETTDTDRDGQGDNADTDLDNDGVLNGADNCPSASNTNQLDTDGDGIGDVCDSDDDGDGHSDSDEVECGSNPLLASSKPLDTDNDGIANCIDTDDDNDGYLDTDETTCGSDPLDATSKPLDTDSDGIANCIDTDDDNDSYLDENDAFPLDATEWLDTDEDGIGNNADTDDDGDGQLDTDEITCGSDPLLASSMSLDTDGDSVPDCEDTDDDNDGVVDTEDAFPLDTTEWTDTDGDGIGNNADTDDDNDGFTDLDELICDSDPLDRFNKPADQDNDLIPDCIDTDRDGDGYLNSEDVFPDDSDEWVDTDGDGLGDNFEVDDDNDGYLDTNDAFPLDPNEWADADGDGVGDNLDTDDNNDGFNDSDLLVSGVLTPNSSGLESTWKIINIDKYPNARVSVYNKNGQEVFSAQGYRNDWRGTYKDSTDPLPASSYYYVIELNTGEGPITGWVYISY